MARITSTLTFALLSIAGSSNGWSQCDLIAEDFDGIAVGTTLNSVPEWRDRSIQSNVQIGTNPCNGTPAIVLAGSPGAVRIAERRLDNLPTPEAFKIQFDVTVWSDSNIRILCPNIFTNNQVEMDTRMLATFDISNGANTITSNGNTLPIVSRSLPIVPGVCVPMSIELDVLGRFRITYDGTLLNEFVWSHDLSPGPCTVPGSFAFLNNGAPSGPGMVIDNVCVSSAEWTRYCPAQPNSTGSVSKIGAFGSSSVVANDLELFATDLPSNSFGYFIAGSGQGFIANPGGYGGNLCLGGTIGRFPQILHSGVDGSVSMPVDWTRIPWPTGSPATVLPGQTWNFQLFHRDQVNGAPTTNFTDGLSITLVP
jgi:hypothetical protein